MAYYRHFIAFRCYVKYDICEDCLYLKVSDLLEFEAFTGEGAEELTESEFESIIKEIERKEDKLLAAMQLMPAL